MGVDVWRHPTSGGAAGARWRRLGGASLCLALLVLIVLAVLLVVAASQARAADTASISGTVTDSAGVPNPLVDVNVRAYRYDGTASWRYVKDSVTGPGGTYTIDALAAGTYRLKFVDGGAFAAEYYNDKPTLALATDIPVAEGAAVTGKNASLVVGGRITGTVTNAAAAPIQFVIASAYQKDGSDWSWTTDDVTLVTGVYDLSGLATGTYRIQFHTLSGAYVPQWYDGKPDLEKATDVAVTAGATTAGINATLAAAGHITGTVKNAAGTGLSGINVTLYRWVASDAWYWVAYGETNPDGTYDMGSLPTGTYTVKFDDPDGAYVTQFYNGVTSWDDVADIAVTAGATTSGINATLAAAGHVSGTVKDAGGAALRGITVVAYRAVGDWWEDETSVRVSEAAGTYDLGGLAAGTYRIMFRDRDGAYATQYYNNKPNLDMATDITVTAGATTSGVDATMAAAGHITGTIKNAGGAVVPNVWVEAYRDDGDGWDYVGEVSTSSAGTYDLAGLPAGTYRVGVQDYNDVYAYQFYVNAWTVTLATDVVVTSGATTSGIDETLAAAGHVTGTVKDSAGAGLKNGLVEAWRFDGAGWQYVDDTSTKGDGSYDLGSLSAGTYRLRFSDRSGSCLPQWYGNTASVESAKDVVVTAGATASGKNATLVAALPRLGTPSCPKSARRGATFKVTGTLKPHYAAGAKTVTVKAYRKTGSKWKLFKSFKAVNSDNRSFSKYTATVKLSKAGQYRFKASTRATAQIPASTTGYSKTMKIK